MKKTLAIIVINISLVGICVAQEHNANNKKITQKTNLFENFESPIFPPNGWRVINKGDPNTWELNTNTPISGNASAAISWNSVLHHNDWLITPAIMPTDGNSVISFKAKNENNTYVDEFNVWLSTTGNNESDFTILLSENIAPPPTPTIYSFDLSDYNNQTVYFAIQAISLNKYKLSVDDFVGPVVIEYANDAGITQIISPSNNLVGSYDIVTELKNFGSSTLTTCDILYNINGFTGTYQWSGQLEKNETESFTIIEGYNFSLAGIYTISITTDLEGDENQYNNGQTKLVTFYDNYTPPFIESFENGFEHNNIVGLPIFQESLLGSQLWTANNVFTDYNRAPRTGNFNAFLRYSNSCWLFLPISLETGKEYIFSIWARQDGNNINNASIKLMVGDSPTQTAMINEIAPQTGLVAGDYQEIKGCFNAPETKTYYVGILGTINNAPWYISIDDISISEVSENDIGIVDIVSPVNNIAREYDVKIILKNYGETTINASEISVNINGNINTYNWTGNLEKDQSELVTVINGYDFSEAGDYTITVNVSTDGDINPNNNQATKNIVIYAPYSVPFTESFENEYTEFQPLGLPLFQQKVLGIYFWEKNGMTNHNRAPRTGEYNATLQWNNDTWLYIPVLVEAGKEYGFSFWARQDGYSIGNASVRISFGSEAISDSMKYEIAPTTNLSNGDYQHISGNFAAPASGLYFIGIFGSINNNSKYISIDDISVTEIESPTNDVAIVSFVDRYGYADEGIIPEIIIRNRGINNADFDITLNVTDNDGFNHFETKTINNLEAGEFKTVTFDNIYFPKHGLFNATMSIEWANDEILSNNTKTAIYTVFTSKNNIAYAYIIESCVGLPEKSPVYFDLAMPEVLVPISDHSEDLLYVWGGAMVYDSWYACDRSFYKNSRRFISIDTESGEKSIINDDLGVYFTDMAYDYTTQTMFGIYQTPSNTFTLATIELDNGIVINLGTNLPGTPITLACNKKGVLYSIFAEDKNLYKLNKKDGTPTLIGNTGVEDIYYVQSMAFDHRNNDVLYWNQQGVNEYGNYYTVNTETGEATLKGVLQGRVELTGFGIPRKYIPSYQITYSVIGGNGELKALYQSVDVESDVFIDQGEIVEFSAIPDIGYKVQSWIVNGNIIDDNTTNFLTLEIFSENINVNVTFEKELTIKHDFANVYAYPNPTKGLFTIKVNRQQTIEITDVLGKIVKKKNIVSDTETIDLSMQPNGIYFIKGLSEEPFTIIIVKQ